MTFSRKPPLLWRSPRSLMVGTVPAIGATITGKAKEDIDQVLRQATDAKQMPGVVAMAVSDRGMLYEGAFGTRNLVKGPDMTLDPVFWIAFMTKAVTFVATMQLVEQDKLQLDQSLGTRLQPKRVRWEYRKISATRQCWSKGSEETRPS
jgi:CubicO group peptidase (beta-lactamase class C family)